VANKASNNKGELKLHLTQFKQFGNLYIKMGCIKDTFSIFYDQNLGRFVMNMKFTSYKMGYLSEFF